MDEFDLVLKAESKNEMKLICWKNYLINSMTEEEFDRFILSRIMY